MTISSIGAGANINVGVVSRPVFAPGDDSDHDNGPRNRSRPERRARSARRFRPGTSQLMKRARGSPRCHQAAGMT